MIHIFLDFEMNPIPRKNQQAREIVPNEIIEIGAVKLNEDYVLVDRYSAYVKPELNKISSHITKLTGIRDEDVESALLLRDALPPFAAWIGDKPVRIYSWSASDQKQLYQECKLKEIEPPSVFHRWMDFQRVYTRLVGLSRRSALSLRNAIGSVESEFEGQQHSAVADAENAASLLSLVKDKEAFAERTRIIMQLLQPKKAATTLGDLFADVFSQLEFEEEIEQDVALIK